jgi:hypothetical protein
VQAVVKRIDNRIDFAKLPNAKLIVLWTDGVNGVLAARVVLSGRGETMDVAIDDRMMFDMDIRENMEHNLEPEVLRHYHNMEAGFALKPGNNNVVT